MDISKIKLGNNPTEEFNAIIEIPSGGVPIKYEIDKESGALIVDRFVATPMYYPTNYGFLPNTLGKDGDPLDVLVITPIPIMAGSVIKVRPIGVLLMEDESGIDEKIIAIPVNKVTITYKDIQTYKDLPEILLKQITHFFERYKDLEPNKWVKVQSFADKEKAQNLIRESIIRVEK